MSVEINESINYLKAMQEDDWVIVFDEIDKLRRLRLVHIKMSEGIISAHDGGFYSIDLLVVATLNRSMCLLKGFCDLIVKKNFIAATPLVRMQLDNLMRFSASWLVLDPQIFAIEIYEGKHVRDMTNKDGKPMTDRYLVEKLAEVNPRFLSLYEETSGYVHLSNKHMYNAIQLADEDANKGKRMLNMKVTDEDAFIPLSGYLEVIDAFRDVTTILFWYMQCWCEEKKILGTYRDEDGHNEEEQKDNE